MKQWKNRIQRNERFKGSKGKESGKKRAEGRREEIREDLEWGRWELCWW